MIRCFTTTDESPEAVFKVILTCVAFQEDDELPWERKEKLEKLAKEEGEDLPFAVYLIGSAIIAIAAV